MIHFSIDIYGDSLLDHFYIPFNLIIICTLKLIQVSRTWSYVSATILPILRRVRILEDIRFFWIFRRKNFFVSAYIKTVLNVSPTMLSILLHGKWWNVSECVLLKFHVIISIIFFYYSFNTQNGFFLNLNLKFFTLHFPYTNRKNSLL